MTNNQIDPNQELNNNELSEEELEQVAGGGLLRDLADAGKQLVGDVIHEGKDFVSDVKYAWKKRH